MGQPKNGTRESSNALTATLIGIAAGAAGIFLLNRHNREELMAKINSLIEKGDKRLEDLSEQAKTVKEKGRRKIIQGLEKAQNNLETNQVRI